MEPPDAQEKVIRFGCGFTFGAMLSAGAAVSWAVASGEALLVAIMAAGVVFGWLAMRLGDPFWHRVASLARWWS